ncbi:FKBP12-interacting protein of 37 kDa-like [Rosa rugosa]|uniref:FKBP12-interacting protein of 37 kDa-like n=1 Tax=Rosa rugosa TaxID=74645 RepID=UPI002B40DBF4|nr:FKBP12-interacting protein of 37 kDa-like [Rosa rugosa]
MVGNKRSFGEIEDEDDFFGSKQVKAKVEETAPGVPTGMILSLRESWFCIEYSGGPKLIITMNLFCSLQTCKDDLAKCQIMKYDAAKSEVQKWHSAFQNEPFINPGTSPDLVLNLLMEGWKPCCIGEEELRKPCWKCLIVCSNAL